MLDMPRKSCWDPTGDQKADLALICLTYLKLYIIIIMSEINNLLPLTNSTLKQKASSFILS